MSHFQQHSDFYDKPIFLSEEEKKAPLSVFEDFFTDYKLNEIREIHQHTVHVCLTSDSPPFHNVCERDRLLHYRETVEKVLEAAYLLLQQKMIAPGSSPQQNAIAESKNAITGDIDLSDLQTRVVDICNR
jgi:hypothetical protein